jgi:hypothetical protein
MTQQIKTLAVLYDALQVGALLLTYPEQGQQ